MTGRSVSSLVPAIRTRGDMRLHEGRSLEGGTCKAYRNTGSGGPDRGGSILSSSGPQCLGERLSELCQSGADSCLHGSERLIQLCCCFGIRHLGEKCGLDSLSLVRREDLQGLSQEVALLLERRRPRRGHSKPSPEVDRPHDRLTRFFRWSNRNRSIALDRAWFMIHPMTGPPAGSYDEARRHTSWNTSSVSSSAVSRLLVIRMIRVNTIRCVRSYRAHAAPTGRLAAMDWTSPTQSLSGIGVFALLA